MTRSILRGRVVTADTVLDDAVVTVEADRIVSVERVSARQHDDSRTALPPPVGTILPGLVDLHNHGGGGHAFTTTSTEEAAAAAGHHHRNGTTTLLASLVTAPAGILLDQVTALRPLAERGDVAGLHLEGPFLSAARCGAQDPAHVIDPDPRLIDRLVEAAGGLLRMMTLAPERTGYAQAARQLTDHGVRVALGHSDAGHGTFAGALRDLAGRGIVTHLANGMPPLHHRDSGPVGAALVEAAHRGAVLELIADGTHVDDGFVSLVFATAPGQVALVSDAMSAAGMRDGDYRLGSQQVTVRDGIARLAGPAGEPGSIAGGTTHLIEQVARCVTGSAISLLDAVRAASLTPAAALGLDHVCGSLTPGLHADLLVTDAELRLQQVMRRGVWLT